MLSKLPGKKMRELLIEYGGPLLPSENRARWQERIARTLKETPRLIRSAFDNEIRNPEHRLKWKLVEAIRQREDHSKRQEAAGRKELAAFLQRLEALEHRLQQIDPDFHSAQINPLRKSMRNMGGVDRP